MPSADLALRHLAALAAVVETGSHRRAAEQLGYSQGAITQQLAALERSLGTPLLQHDGGPRPARLTPAGQEAYAAARDLLGRVDLLEQRLAALRLGHWGRLAIGTFASVSATLLPPALARLRAEAPEVQVSVLESDDNEVLVGALVAGRLDVSFLVGPVAHPDLRITEVTRDEVVAVVAADDANEGPLTLTELATRPLVGHGRCVCHALVEQGFALAGLVPRWVFRSNDNAAVQAMVREGVGTAVMPRLAVHAEDPRVRLLPIEPPLPARSIRVALPRTEPAPTASALVDLVLDRPTGGYRRVRATAEALPPAPSGPGRDRLRGRP